jgi:hypothetical protein
MSLPVQRNNGTEKSRADDSSQPLDNKPAVGDVFRFTQ